jgi:A/G-specific adenine glycosylase
MDIKPFHRQLLAWFDQHGRKDFPWQRNPTPYRVWVSEIMLQQTQVASVIPYFERFMQRFPALQMLADAPLDEVLHLWAGLGYYARARNLHRAAQIIRDTYNNQFPTDLLNLTALPGIGRSTGSAILALSVGQRHAILDGNVKRVLTRLCAVTGWPGQKEVEKKLWTLAERVTPKERVAHYTQAMMDLGATVCTRTNPICGACPLKNQCVAFAQQRVQDFPAPRPRKTLPVRKRVFVIISDINGRVLLEQRPPTGIWGGLWSFPECENADEMRRWCRLNLACDIEKIQQWPVVRHTFSHFHLDITPIHAQLTAFHPTIMEPGPRVWYNTRMPDKRGLPAPVKDLLERMPETKASL